MNILNKHTIKKYTVIFLAFLSFTFPSLTFSQDRPSLLVLGSAHFNNSGQDVINLEVDDILTSQRQIEIKDVIDQLVKFNPTHIAIEFPSQYQEVLNERYYNYRAGEYELSRSESDQLGLRLAAVLDHEKVYAVDWNSNPPGDIEADYNWFSYGQTNGHETTIAEITDPSHASEYYFELKDQTISTWLKQLNHPDALKSSHQVYFDIASIGDGEQMIGANWVGTWYARNLKIFSRLVKLAESPDDRVLIIYGQGHAYLLQQFALESSAFNLVSVSEVLNEQ